MAGQAVKALLFDVFGTVVDWRTSIARELAEYFVPEDVERDWLSFADAWRRRYQPAMEAVRSGRRGFLKLDELHRENLVATLAEFELEGLPDDAIEHLNRAWHRLDPWPDSVEGMRRLKRRYILGSLSNGNVGADCQPGQTRRSAMGRDPGRGGSPRLQAAAGSLFAGCRSAVSEAGFMLDGGRSQQRSDRRPRLRIENRLLWLAGGNMARISNRTWIRRSNLIWWLKTSKTLPGNSAAEAA